MYRTKTLSYERAGNFISAKKREGERIKIIKSAVRYYML